MGQKAHDAGDHRHADDGMELFSQLFGQPGFDQLTSAWITARWLVASQDIAGVAPVEFSAEPASVTPIPPPGPPPRGVALNGGGGFPR